MNIFAVHSNSMIAASMLCDAHCNKMVLEGAQMLANCFSQEQLNDAPYTKEGKPRKYSHYNHPCSVWARKTKSNMRWLFDHTVALEHERRKRGYNPHFVSGFLSWVGANFSQSLVPDGPLTEFAVAISTDSLCRKAIPNFNKLNIVDQYRAFYNYDKASFAKWKNGNVPEWFAPKVVQEKC